MDIKVSRPVSVVSMIWNVFQIFAVAPTLGLLFVGGFRGITYRTPRGEIYEAFQVLWWQIRTDSTVEFFGFHLWAFTIIGMFAILYLGAEYVQSKFREAVGRGYKADLLASSVPFVVCVIATLSLWFIPGYKLEDFQQQVLFVWLGATSLAFGMDLWFWWKNFKPAPSAARTRPATPRATPTRISVPPGQPASVTVSPAPGTPAPQPQSAPASRPQPPAKKAGAAATPAPLGGASPP